MCHVLIIEDEPLIALDIEGILSAVGATSFAFADTEEEAIAAAAAHRPDVITADIVLREGSGASAVALIEARHGPQAVIFITATPEDCASPCDRARVLRKPLSESALAHAFRELRAD